ncbi:MULTISPECIES: hypothetical protein [Corynebacterium]|uniref:hypothetical protein n=1 Tax=Corynebacterium TaxID=1716 RepID=UPI00124DC50E|nr:MULTISPECIES: hypothetical protein [Corynebacterium]
MDLGISYGYPLPDQSLAEVTDHSFTFDGLPVVNDESRENQKWDYQTKVGFSCTLLVDLPSFIAGMGIPSQLSDEVSLTAFIEWHSSGTKLRGISHSTPLHDGANRLSLEVLGDQLAMNLSAVVKIALSKNDIDDESIMSARIPGALLWESERFLVDLEGEGARFPIITMNFEESGMQPANAMWLIVFNGTLATPAQSAVHACVNISNQVSKAMISKPDSKEAKMWKRFLIIDVISELVLHGAAHAEEIDSLSDEDAGSLGESIQNLMTTLSPMTLLRACSMTPLVSAQPSKDTYYSRKSK